MNVLQKCCFRSLKENRKRTLVTIVGVILATALITGVACLAVSFRASMIEYEKIHTGDYHYRFAGVKEENLKYFINNQHLEKIGFREALGYAVLEGSQNPDKPYLYLCAVDEAGMAALGLQLSEGRMPENASELVISRHIRTNAMVDLQVGDELTLGLGQRISEGAFLQQANPYAYAEEELVVGERRSYTIVGIIERPTEEVEQRWAPGYSVFTYLEEPLAAETLDVYATYTDWALRHARQVSGGLQELADSVTDNYYLLKWVFFSFSSRTMNMLYAVAAVAIVVIMVTSVLCIRNSFAISMTEKMRLYGRLASVGTTTKQQRKIVYYEAAVLGGVGIPLGILSGSLASVILVQAVSGLTESALKIPLVFGISWTAVALAAVLAAVTIFCSARQSAKRAARVSPISAIRSNDTVKLPRRELRCPFWVGKLFGIGGKVAYKNLKRARGKYRTTVISIAVSVAVFIGMTSLMGLIGYSSQFYYENRQYQFRATCYDKDSYRKLQQIAELEGVQEAEVVRFGSFTVPAKSLPLTEAYQNGGVQEEQELEKVRVYSLGEEAYARYCQRAGVSEAEARDQAIVLAEYEWNTFDEQDQMHVQSGDAAHFQPGDVLESQDGKISVTLLAQTGVKPLFMNGQISSGIVLIVSDSWMDSHWELLDRDDKSMTEVYLKCDSADRIEEIVRRDMNLVSFFIANYEAQYQSDRSMYLLLSVFLYGFITVVALIGITNIFNTITTNMELRAPEFAMLRAIGMTRREFRRMIRLESFFYGGRALLFGIPLGILIAWCFNRALGQGIVTSFSVPWNGIGIAIAAVAVLLFGTMHYSMEKINRKNIVETIRNENL
ncbi:MAG: FtsX-like permease family protein [Lachnospiraceae bacterium]|nr:FtsX-like permease family protein [Lachnospiraceae bacterium]